MGQVLHNTNLFQFRTINQDIIQKQTDAGPIAETTTKNLVQLNTATID
jgi:hypothetical protein